MRQPLATCMEVDFEAGPLLTANTLGYKYEVDCVSDAISKGRRFPIYKSFENLKVKNSVFYCLFNFVTPVCVGQKKGLIQFQIGS